MKKALKEYILGFYGAFIIFACIFGLDFDILIGRMENRLRLHITEVTLAMWGGVLLASLIISAVMVWLMSLISHF